MTTCSKCERENSDNAQFCGSCRTLLLRQCPKCWHQQRRRGRCEKCGGNMSLGWRVHAAAALAATVKEEMVNREASRRRAARNLQMAELAMNARAALLALIGSRFASQWLSRLRSEE